RELIGLGPWTVERARLIIDIDQIEARELVRRLAQVLEYAPVPVHLGHVLPERNPQTLVHALLVKGRGVAVPLFRWFGWVHFGSRWYLMAVGEHTLAAPLPLLAGRPGNRSDPSHLRARRGFR